MSQMTLPTACYVVFANSILILMEIESCSVGLFLAYMNSSSSIVGLWLEDLGIGGFVGEIDTYKFVWFPWHDFLVDFDLLWDFCHNGNLLTIVGISSNTLYDKQTKTGSNKYKSYGSSL